MTIIRDILVPNTVKIDFSLLRHEYNTGRKKHASEYSQYSQFLFQRSLKSPDEFMVTVGTTYMKTPSFLYKVKKKMLKATIFF